MSCTEKEEIGHGEAIKEFVARSTENVRLVAYRDIGKEGLEVQGNVFVDTTGLGKPALFQSVRSALKQADKVWIAIRGRRYIIRVMKIFRKLLMLNAI
ncbi:MAG: hypothetical protein ABR577_00530 [Pyrinomonadaceae bacterium]